MTTIHPPAATEPAPTSAPELQPYDETELDDLFERLGEPADDTEET